MDTLEKLLLLEILVDSVYYEKTAIDPTILKQLQDTNVKFQFLNYPPIDIGESDFCQTGEGYDNSEISLKSGKSILFALPDTSSGIRQSFDINVTVSRKIAVAEKGPTGKETNVQLKLHDLGKTVIRLGESFINLLEATSYDGVCPTSTTVRDSYPFNNEAGNIIGYVTVFVRLSCFGKIIVTQFQADTLDDKEKSFCFKGGEDEGAPVTPPEVEHIPKQYYGGGEPPISQPMMYPQAPSMFPQVVKVPVALKRRPIAPRCGKVPSELVSSDTDGEKKGPYCLHRNCPQGYPMPPWVPGGTGRAGRRGGGKTRGGSAGKPDILPIGAAAFRGDDILFQMSDPKDPNIRANKENITFKIDHEPNQPRQNVQMVHSDFKPAMDDENDVFLLRFGKKDVSSKPAKLIISMKTPKVPYMKVFTSEIYSQTENIPKPPSNQSLTTTEVAVALGKKPKEEGKAKEKGKKKGK